MTYNTGTPTEYLNIPTMAAGDVPALDTNGLTVILNAIDSAMHGIGGGDVSSVFARTGAVTAESGDHTDAQISDSATNTLTTKGDILYAGAANTLARLPIRSATGAPLRVGSAGLPGWELGALTAYGVVNLASTTSTSPVMAGLGAYCRYTVTTGYVAAYAKGVLGASGGEMLLMFGTGTAPAQGAALTGTTLDEIGWSTGDGLPFAVVVGSASLTVGTSYWFDLAYCTNNSSAAQAPTSVLMGAFDIG